LLDVPNEVLALDLPFLSCFAWVFALRGFQLEGVKNREMSPT
jgi:hypothetical protein